MNKENGYTWSSLVIWPVFYQKHVCVTGDEIEQENLPSALPLPSHKVWHYKAKSVTAFLFSSSLVKYKADSGWDSRS